MVNIWISELKLKHNFIMQQDNDSKAKLRLNGSKEKQSRVECPVLNPGEVHWQGLKQETHAGRPTNVTGI